MRDFLDLYDLPFYNNSGEEIPPYGVMQSEDWKDDENDRDYFKVRKPNGSGKVYLVNGPLAVPSGGDGMGSRHAGVLCKYASGTPAVDQEWGPISGSWSLSSSGTGFIVVGGLESVGDASLVRSLISPAGGGSTLRWGEATSTISAATAWGTFGSGTVQPKDDAGVNDGSPISVENRFWDSFLNKSIVCYDTKYDPPRIVSVGCTPAT